jgi:hypothetical protein
MGQVIDFQEAKAKILGHTTAEEPKTVSTELSNAIEEFSFSRLPKVDRIARSLYQALRNGQIRKCVEGDPTLAGGSYGFSLEDLASELAPYLPEDIFNKPLSKAVATNA